MTITLAADHFVERIQELQSDEERQKIKRYFKTSEGEYGEVTQRSVLDALEVAHPVLTGTIRDHQSQMRRHFIQFFACEQYLSHGSPDNPLPEPVAQGRERILVVGAIAGGQN